jgi:hypothetical protein
LHTIHLTFGGSVRQAEEEASRNCLPVGALCRRKFNGINRTYPGKRSDVGDRDVALGNKVRSGQGDTVLLLTEERVLKPG